MKLSKGRIMNKGLKVVLYGPEGIGKSTFASRFPDPLFIDIENGTRYMDVLRIDPAPQSWTELMEIIRELSSEKYKDGFDTLVLDTADWAQRMCAETICASNKMQSIESFGYGRGYTYLAEEFGRLLNHLEMLIERGKNVVITAHAMMRKFEQPDEMGSYDRWELKLEKKVAPLIKEWADLLLFANYKTMVINVDNKGAAQGKNKVQGGARVMYTSHHPCWDAKNRFGLPDELPFEFDRIAHILPAAAPIAMQTAPEPAQRPATPLPQELGYEPIRGEEAQKVEAVFTQEDPNSFDEAVPFGGLMSMMRQSGVSCKEVRWAVAQAGYYPEDTPIATYDPEFVNGELLPNWAVCVQMIEAARANDVPF